MLVADPLTVSIGTTVDEHGPDATGRPETLPVPVQAVTRTSPEI